jgi:RHS repeat-associated protein
LLNAGVESPPQPATLCAMPVTAPPRSCPRRGAHARTGGRNSRPPKLADPAPHTAISGRRYYCPNQGRFLGRDPIKEKGGLNLYGFCLNNPINLWDYLGNYAIFERNGNDVTITVPIYFSPGTDQAVIDTAKKGIEEMFRGQFGDITLTTNVQIMTEAPSAKNLGNTLNVLPSIGTTSVSNYGNDPRTGNGILTIYDTQATESVIAHEAAHAMGLKDQYERLWRNTDTGDERFFPAGEIPGKDWERRSVTRTPSGWENTLMGDRGVLTLSQKDFDLLMNGLSENRDVWVVQPDGSLRRATDKTGPGSNNDAPLGPDFDAIKRAIKCDPFFFDPEPGDPE